MANQNQRLLLRALDRDFGRLVIKNYIQRPIGMVKTKLVGLIEAVYPLCRTTGRDAVEDSGTVEHGVWMMSIL